MRRLPIMSKIFTKSEIMNIKEKIYEVRGTKVMLDYDVSRLFEYETRVFNQLVKRHESLFKDNSYFQLSSSEFEVIKANKNNANLTSQVVTSSWGGTRKVSFAFTIKGIHALQNIIKSENSFEIIRAIDEAFNFVEVVDFSKKETQSVSMAKFHDMIYLIRGQQVMLDSELAEYYGYETRRFNEQIKNNLDRFDPDFMLELTKTELNSILMSKKSTSSWGGNRKSKYAFTEQGVYMVMTVLKGEEAARQSKLLVRLFKSMKDYLTSSNQLTNSDGLVKLTMQVNENTQSIKELNNKIYKQDEKLTEIMDKFIDPSTYKRFLILNGQKIEADVAYQEIFKQAHESIILIDDYISIKTLNHLKSVNPSVLITIYSDNVAKDKINDTDLADFKSDTGIDILLFPTNKRIHDRMIILDNSVIYHSGSSIKDSGNSLTYLSQIEDGNPSLYIKTILDVLNKKK